MGAQKRGAGEIKHPISSTSYKKRPEGSVRRRGTEKLSSAHVLTSSNLHKLNVLYGLPYASFESNTPFKRDLSYQRYYHALSAKNFCDKSV